LEPLDEKIRIVVISMAGEEARIQKCLRKAVNEAHKGRRDEVIRSQPVKCNDVETMVWEKLIIPVMRILF
jgi:DNA-binding transcriptional regulator PaaX